MRDQVNDIAFNQDLLGRSDTGDHGSVTTDDTDRGFALRRFLMTTESVFSGSPPGSPGKTSNREGSVSPPPITIGAQPPQGKKDSEGSKSVRNGDSGSVSRKPVSSETESRPVKRTQRGGVRTGSIIRRAYKNILPEEDLEVSQPAQDQENRHLFSKSPPGPGDVTETLATMHGSDTSVYQTDTRADSPKLSRRDHQARYSRRQQRLADLHKGKKDNLPYKSPPSLAKKTDFLDGDDDDRSKNDSYQPQYPKPSARSSNSSGGLRGPKSHAELVHANALLLRKQENVPTGTPAYVSFFEEEQVEESQAPSFRMDEHPSSTAKKTESTPKKLGRGQTKRDMDLVRYRVFLTTPTTMLQQIGDLIQLTVI